MFKPITPIQLYIDTFLLHPCPTIFKQATNTEGNNYCLSYYETTFIAGTFKKSGIYQTDLFVFETSDTSPNFDTPVKSIRTIEMIPGQISLN